MEKQVSEELSQSTTDFNEDSLFKLQCLIKAPDIQHSVQCQFRKSHILAFTTGNADIVLYFKRDATSVPIIKRIPWFQVSHKQISALCFHPLGSWLLCATVDGSLYILPALLLIDDQYNIVPDEKWSIDDVTFLPSAGMHSSFSRPTAIVWWKDVLAFVNVAIVGTEYGEIVLINLDNGKHVGLAHVNGNIANLHICKDEDNRNMTLLITSQAKQQWRLLLEGQTYSCLRQLDNTESFTVLQHPNETIHDNAKTFASTRSRLQGLKQLSIEKLAILRQKSVETRNQNFGESTKHFDAGGNGNNNCMTIGSQRSFVSNSVTIIPEPIAKETFLTSQCNEAFFRKQQLYTCYHSSTNRLTVHGSDTSAAPLSIHKVLQSNGNILLTQRFFFITDETQCTLYIISDRLSETRSNKDSDFNPECIVGNFCFDSSKEMIRAVYRAPDFKTSTRRKLSQVTESRCTIPTEVNDLEDESPCIDTCIIVTNRSIYKIILRKPLLTVFMDLALKHNDLKKAAKLAFVFGMNGQQLLEYAGDILLSNKESPRAVAAYKLSKCKLFKTVLKFASTGHTSELLSCLTYSLVSPRISEFPVAARIHLSNLCVLAFIEMTFRATSVQSKAIYKDFLYFLSTNTFYDELLVVNIAGQTCLWEVLHRLATQRGLYEQMLDILMKTVYTPGTKNSYPMPCGMLICLSEPSLMQAMLINPNLARNHMAFVVDNLPEFQVFVLQRLVTLYNPTNPVLRPRMMHCKARHRTTSHSSQSSQCDSIDLTDNADESDTLIEEILETFLLILLTLIYKRGFLGEDTSYMYGIQTAPPKKDHVGAAPSNVDFRRRAISAGYAHVALIRNGDVYTWGNSAHGCLGTGPSVLRFGLPQAISFFQHMKVEVLSVSCGHCHTLAVTNNGIYAWGASQYGQLGLGKVLQCSTPELISTLAREIVIDAVAGQYHSVALTVDGRMFTWGWGVHGQLGHGNTEEKSVPTLVASLLDVVVRCISAGHAHTLALSVEGIVYAFGCNVFGQLGVGTNVKSSIPIKVSLPERVSLIATGYFHNLAVSSGNKVYVWGASPQVLRLQAQAQKKTRYLERQDMLEKKTERCEDDGNRESDAANNGNAVSTLREGTPVARVQNERDGSETKRRYHHESIKLKNINVGLLEEALTHLTPSMIDTSLVKNQIIQISTGCHHNALLTKDGSLYTWGRNTDGQIGNGTRREELIPTPLCYNPASIFAQVPPRHSNYKKLASVTTATEAVAPSEEEQKFPDAKNGNTSGEYRSDRLGSEDVINRESVNPVIKAVGICCGYDYTVAIQPDGRILAWGNNSKAQLGRLPMKDPRDGEDKLVMVKPSKRILRLPHTSHVALDIPNRVPDISAPVISYQSYDVPSLAGVLQPLSVIESSPGELTLHYVLDHFNGLYDYGKIMEKSVELRNYQVCSKIARLQQNISDAFMYELERLNALSLQSSMARHSEGSNLKRGSYAAVRENMKKNTELFNRQVEKNLIESMVDCATRNRMKIPASKSLNSLQTLEQELHSFDCQGGSEELCKDSRCDDAPLDIADEILDNDFNNPIDTEEWFDNTTVHNDTSRNNEKAMSPTKAHNQSTDKRMIDSNAITLDQESRSLAADNNTMHREVVLAYSLENNITNETIKVIKFYLSEMENDTDMIKYKILRKALEFWIEQNLPPQSLENVFLEHVDNIFYPLGLLLFCQEIMERYLDAGRNDILGVNLYIANIFSAKFCLQICSKLLRFIDQGQPTPEYVKLLSCLTADHYGPPLTGYPGSAGNNTSKEMVDGVISTVSCDSQESRSFVHIKDPDAVYRFLALEEDRMVFTCGHHFPAAAYQSELIPGMETELLTTQSLLLPCTAQFLGKILCQTSMPEIVCPLCIPRALGSMVKKSKG